jgi:hypothetical protein
MKLFSSLRILSLQYNLDFRGLSPRGRNVTYGRDDDISSGATGMEGGKYSSAPSSDPSIWQFGMARNRAKGDARRTRVSFLLF